MIIKQYVSAFLLAALILPIQMQAQKKPTVKPWNPDNTLNNTIALIPQPTELTPKPGFFTLTGDVKLFVSFKDAGARQIATDFSQHFETICGMRLALADADNEKPGTKSIYFDPMKDNSLGEEGYRLSVVPERIVIKSNSDKGYFYAVQTIYQLLPPAVFSIQKLLRPAIWRMPAAEITDIPRFKYRGMHLDVCRHFFGVDFVKKYIDLLAMHKMNTFHWHLTDDQGWRIEINKYPKLTEVGSVRKETLVGHYSDTPVTYDGKPYKGYYTQEEIKEVVAYAKARFVDIVPEIEMPGHAKAALAAYPELACTDGPFEVATTWGVFDDVFCPSEKTFTFLEDVLTEVMDLFPGKYIHIGGDECPKTRWEKSSFCQKLMHKQGLKDEHALQSYFIQRIEKFVNSKGRRIIGWDEILEGGLAPNATVMSWRGTEGGIAAAKEGHDVVMTPGSNCYFDYYQADPSHEPLAIGGMLTLETVYSYEPTPAELSPEQAKHILGAQGNLWTEYIADNKYAEYMAFPRACALAEVDWSPREKRDIRDFVKRLQIHLQRLEMMKVNYAKNVYDVKSSLSFDSRTNSTNVKLESLDQQHIIRYTIDGSEPNGRSSQYQGPFAITGSCTVKAQMFQNQLPVGNVLIQSFVLHKCAGKPYTLKYPFEKYNGGGLFGLTDGIQGPLNNYGKWVGFSGKDLDATISLDEATSVTNVTLHFLKYEAAWIYLPQYVEISISDDGTTFTKVASTEVKGLSTEPRSIVEVNIPVSDAKGRFIRVVAKNVGKCPPGSQCAGQDAWLFVDEIAVK